MEGYIQALIDTHRRIIKPSMPTHIVRATEDRISELQGILNYYKRLEKEKAIRSFVLSCKAKDLSEEIKKACRR